MKFNLTNLYCGYEMPLDTLVVLIIFAVLIGCLLIVSTIKFIQVCVRHAKRSKKAGIIKCDYTPIFGGLDNIVKTERSLNRIMVEVVDREKVDLEQLKELKVGAQITGNVIKCSSSEMAESLENIK